MQFSISNKTKALLVTIEHRVLAIKGWDLLSHRMCCGFVNRNDSLVLFQYEEIFV